MSYNFKIGELKENARYMVSTIDKWDGSTKTEEMTGAILKSFTNGCAHLYDIHAEEITAAIIEVKNMNGTNLDYDQAVNMMDDDIRDALHAKMTPCSEQDFFTAYEKAHQKKYGEMWELSKANPTW